jgi:hypothetical protein
MSRLSRAALLRIHPQLNSQLVTALSLTQNWIYKSAFTDESKKSRGRLKNYPHARGAPQECIYAVDTSQAGHLSSLWAFWSTLCLLERVVRLREPPQPLARTKRPHVHRPTSLIDTTLD